MPDFTGISHVELTVRDADRSAAWYEHCDLGWENPSVARFFRRLASFTRLIIFDKRGIGMSDPVTTGEPPTLEERIEDVRAVMDAAGSERAVLFGMSEGGQLAVLFAATYPERALAIVLYSTFAKIRYDADDYPIGVHDEDFEQLLAATERDWGGDAILEFVSPSLKGDDAAKRWWRQFFRRSTSPGAMVAQVRMNFYGDVRALLGSVQAPTLVLHAAQERFIPAVHGRYLAERIPGARYVEVEGGDHFPYLASGDAVAEEIQEFLTGVREPAEPERVLATVLFSDIVGSTERAAAIGDRRWRDVLEAHDATVRRQPTRRCSRSPTPPGGPLSTTRTGSGRLFVVSELALPVGFQRFHRNRFLNYQLNRLHSLGFADRSEIANAAARIKTVDDYLREFQALSERAEAEGRGANAAFYQRAAEFFTPPRSTERRARYDRFIDLFDRAFAGEPMTTHLVPYGGSVMPARRLAAGDRSLGTVVFFGGFDSVVEEFFAIWRLLADAGFDVVAFDGPGQGGARTRYGLTFEHDWERPVAAVLDFFELDQVALIGFSMGGYWAIRAAAYEPRVRYVVAWPPVYDWLEQVPRSAQPAVRRMLAHRRFMTASVRLRTRLSPTLRYVIDQALYLVDSSEPMDAVDWFLGMNAAHLSSDRVTQDVALVGGEHDRFQPPRLLRRQAEALTNARSVTARIFTASEHADQHCQMGNLPLATTWVTSWLCDRAVG